MSGNSKVDLQAGIQKTHLLYISEREKNPAFSRAKIYIFVFAAISENDIFRLIPPYFRGFGFRPN